MAMGWGSLLCVGVVGDAGGAASTAGGGGGHHFFERLSGRDRDELVVRLALGEAAERLAGGALVEVGADESLDVELRVRLGDAADDRAADRGLVARLEPAAQVDLVRLELLAGHAALAQRRALEADVGDPVLGAGVRAAVDEELDALGLAAEGRFDVLQDLVELGL